MRGILWFREDLRISDNPALHHAALSCKDGLIAIYLLDQAMWRQHDIAACRVAFILRGLSLLAEELAELNISFLFIELNPSENVSAKIIYLLKKYQAEALFFNKQYEIDEWRRDEAIKKNLEKENFICKSYDDQVILPPGSVLSQQGNMLKVFTAFKNAWYRVFMKENPVHLFPTPKKQNPLSITSDVIPGQLPDFDSKIDPELWPSGEKNAKRRLNNFIETQLFDYDKTRDFPGLNATSRLSPYLAAGMISARECFKQALQANREELDTGNKGATTWMNELIWRDFYKHLLLAFPRISMHQPFQLETTKIKWRFNEKQLLAWQEGNTGFPLIDAAMRQLTQTGWMHNRLRMCVAMFFTKNLFFDWRLGEKYFMSHLIDGDLAANNGGWQWCASTGTDAAPYFRIFNPISQSKKFDKEGEFIRIFCPELKELDNKFIHEPYAAGNSTIINYPKPLIDLKKSREQAIAAFKKL